MVATSPTQRTRTETWRPVAGYEGWYEVSSLGSVRSLDRVSRHHSGGPKRLKGARLRPGLNNGYPRVLLPRPGTLRASRYVHDLVLRAFVGDPPAADVRIECRHIDGDKTNNTVENLAWGTCAENYADQVRHGRARTGPRRHGGMTSPCLHGHPGEHRRMSSRGGSFCGECARLSSLAYARRRREGRDGD